MTEKRIRVLMFGWEFPPFNSGGLGVACQGLSRALVESGMEIVFVLPRKLGVRGDGMRMTFADEGSAVPNDAIEWTEVDTILAPYMTGETYRRRLETIGGSGEGCHYGDTLHAEVRRYALRAREIALRERFDIIHAHDWLSFLAGIEAKRVSGKPLVVHIHATEYDRTLEDRGDRRIYEIERQGLEEADAVITVSGLTRDIVVRKYGVNPDKVTVVHNGIDAAEGDHLSGDALSAFRHADSRIVLFLGRLTVQKGPDYFLRAAKRVLEYRPETYFMIAGSGDMHGVLVEEAARLGIADRILFTGFLRGKEWREAYRMADLYVMPSISEPFGLTALEAMQHGTPVLVSRQSGVSEAVRHILKVDFWDTEDMADKIIAAIDHEPLRRNIAENGRREVGYVNWRVAARKCAALYGRVLARVV